MEVVQGLLVSVGLMTGGVALLAFYWFFSTRKGRHPAARPGDHHKPRGR
jgi:hypothetical protein